jgi:hypothetical protein
MSSRSSRGSRSGGAQRAAASGGTEARYGALNDALSAFLCALDAAGRAASCRRRGATGSLAAASRCAMQLLALADTTLPPDGCDGDGVWRPPGALAERLWRHAFGPCSSDAAGVALVPLATLFRRCALKQQLLTEPAVDGLVAALLDADKEAATAEAEAAAAGAAAGIPAACLPRRSAATSLRCSALFFGTPGPMTAQALCPAGPSCSRARSARRARPPPCCEPPRGPSSCALARWVPGRRSRCRWR